MNSPYYIYDLEVYPNIFVLGGKFRGERKYQQFEISDRVNELNGLISWLSYLRNAQVEMIGFNNLEYDYPMTHELMTNPYLFTFEHAFNCSQQIITSQNRGMKPFHVRHSDRMIAQIDLMKVCHFDNNARRTSLKALQFAMRSDSVEDLPYKIRPLNHQEKDHLKKYNIHDLDETEKFFDLNEHAIDMRREYLNEGILQGDVLNFNDVKIGTEYLMGRIGRNKCFSGSKPRQTFRTQVEFNRIILPKIEYRTEPFRQVIEWFKKQIIYPASEGATPKLEAKLGGLDFHFGVGGVHASADNKIYHSDENYQIIDIDVAGMYVAVANANKFGPEHLGESFVVAYKQVKEDRARYAKGTPRNAVMKLAGNGAFGHFNNAYSYLYDPQCLYSITTNGQLQLLQLVEMLDLLPDCELIQANTDGITVRVRKDQEHFFKLWCKEWEKMTGLELEEVKYSRMWIRDVNNYIAEKTNGELKRKGAYWYPMNTKEYDGWWNKDFSNIASIKAAEKAMTHSWSLEMAIRLITDPFDFMLRYKTQGDAVVYIGDVAQLKTVRYYVSVSGEPMKKVSGARGEIGQYKKANGVDDKVYEAIMKEIGKNVWDVRIHTKNKSKHDQVTTSIESGWKIKQCNVASKFDWLDVDWKYYIEEAKKLIVGSK
jgi:hypothetical protein